MIKTSLLIEDRPSSFRFPRGSALGLDISGEMNPLEIGKGNIIKEGNNIALINFGARLNVCIDTVNNLSKKGLNITLVDARFAKPIDTMLLDRILDNHEYILTIEEGSIGGFSSIVLDYIHNKRKKKTTSKIQNLIFPDIFIEHDTAINQYKKIGMDAESIEKKILSFSIKKEIYFKAIYNS